MKKLFLCSFFKSVAGLLPEFIGGKLTGKTVAFIPTACVPEKVNFFVKSGKKALEKLGLIVDELELTKAASDEISGKLQQSDLIYITGGNTFFLLQELRRNGADKIIAEQIAAGKPYIGESAGAMVVAPYIDYAKGYDDCTKAPDLTDYAALGIVNFYPCPHYAEQPFKKAVEKIIAKYEAKLTLKPIGNSQAILVSGDNATINGVE